MTQKSSNERQDLNQEELDQEPSLDKMLDLEDPKTLKGLGNLVRRLQEEEREREEREAQRDDS